MMRLDLTSPLIYKIARKREEASVVIA